MKTNLLYETGSAKPLVQDYFKDKLNACWYFMYIIHSLCSKVQVDLRFKTCAV